MPCTYKDIAKWFKEYNKPLLYLAWKSLDNKEDAEDVVSKFWVKVLERPPEKITKGFLYISIMNACRDIIKTKQRHPKEPLSYLEDVQEDEDRMKALIMNTELLKIISDQIEKLPKTRKLIFKKTYFDGLSAEEISKQLNISVKTIYNQRFMGIKELRMSSLIKQML